MILGYWLFGIPSIVLQQVLKPLSTGTWWLGWLTMGVSSLLQGIRWGKRDSWSWIKAPIQASGYQT